MILVDSSVWIVCFRNEPTAKAEWLDKNLESEGLVAGGLMMPELLQGFKEYRDLNEVPGLLGRLLQVKLSGEEIAVEAARNFRKLSSRGVTVRGTTYVPVATLVCL